jgi:hypothetical protein
MDALYSLLCFAEWLAGSVGFDACTGLGFKLYANS